MAHGAATTRIGLAAVVLATACGCYGPQTTVVPTTFSSYNSPDGAFACEYPDGWEVEGNAKRNNAWARFSSGSATIRMQANIASSLLSDAMGGRSADINAPAPELAPVHQIHVRNEELAAGEYKGYRELTGSPKILDCPIGPGRVSEFTYSGAFGAPMHGYRATTISNKTGVNVVCLCPHSEWKALKPAFDRLLTTLERGVVE